MNNVIYDNESIIGTKENIWKEFKKEIINELNDNTIDLEILKSNVNDFLEIMIVLQENKDIYYDTLLKITECAMGGFTYKILKESE